MPVLNKDVTLPEHVQIRLKSIQDDFEEGDITLKGYCKQKLAVLGSYLAADTVRAIKQIQHEIEVKKVNENVAYLNIQDLLRLEVSRVLRSTENLTSSDSVQASCSKTAANSLHTPKITNFFHRTAVTGLAKGGSSVGEVATEQIENSTSVKRKASGDSEVLKVKKSRRETAARCNICKQCINGDVVQYPGHPTGAADEFVALTHPKLMLFTGDEGEVNAQDAFPHNKVTQFSVYDQEGHLCPFDTGLVEDNVPLYLSGYLKPIYEEDSGAEGGVAAKDCGPISEWWVSGFDGGERALLGVTTAFGQYYLMDATSEYAPLMRRVLQKVALTKCVIEFLRQQGTRSTYEDLLDHLHGRVSEEQLLRHAQFVCDQVGSFDEAADGDEELLVTTPCMRALVQLAGVTFARRRELRRAPGTKGTAATSKGTGGKQAYTRATTTALVRGVFEAFFPDQLEGRHPGEHLGDVECARRLPYASCKQVLHLVHWTGASGGRVQGGALVGAMHIRPGDCVMLYAARPGQPLLVARVIFMYEAGGGRFFHGRLFCRAAETVLGEVGDARELYVVDECETCPLGAVVCKTRVEVRLPGVVEAAAAAAVVGEASTEVDEIFYCHKKYDRMSGRFEDLDDEFVGSYGGKSEFYGGKQETHGGSEDIHEGNGDMHGGRVEMHEKTRDREDLGDLQGGRVKIHGGKSEIPGGSKDIHGDREDIRGGRVENNEKRRDREDLEDFQRGRTKTSGRSNGIRGGGVQIDEKGEDTEQSHGSREDIHEISKRLNEDFDETSEKMPGKREKMDKNPQDSETSDGGSEDKIEYKYCAVCRKKRRKQIENTPTLVDGGIRWKNQEYRPGCGVYLLPGTFTFTTAPHLVHNVNMREDDPVDEDIYPEYYRKRSDLVPSAAADRCDPFCVGYVTGVPQAPPGAGEDLRVTVRKLYRPENTHKGAGLALEMDLNLVYWSEEELTIPFGQVVGRCYLAYGDILDGPAADWALEGPDRFYFRQTYCSRGQQFVPVAGSGCFVGGRSKGKCMGADAAAMWPHLDRPLRAMDIFAGCGGLSEGLHQSGAAETLWAIEKEAAAAHAFQLNHPQATVYPEDCNVLLAQVLAGAVHTAAGVPLPARGAVELLCGGPPCQGFSGMNQFSAGQYSRLKNSLIATYLSYCDHYRPRYFILENVRNFTTFKRGAVLKLTLRCLLALGYQCAFGVLQAGSFGVPQSRRRLFIVAAAPGQVLPRFPEPLHVFHRRALQLSVVLDGCKYAPASHWLHRGAPYRTITVRDAMCDLPAVRNGASAPTLRYDSGPVSHFQRQMRGDLQVLQDHVCKEMAPIVEARMERIPTAAGSDWRDLPNAVVRLADGTFSRRLVYRHHDRRAGKSATGMFRGVCACVGVGGRCDAQDRQDNTLVPWCLPHTAARHNQWAGLYGRLDWAGVFSTTVTNPEPMGKQGRVLHPEQHRVVSVRECARSQGFRDAYRFGGGVLDKYRQIGNAVPPPLAAAVGRELVRAAVHQVLAAPEEDTDHRENARTVRRAGEEAAEEQNLGVKARDTAKPPTMLLTEDLLDAFMAQQYREGDVYDAEE